MKQRIVIVLCSATAALFLLFLGGAGGFFLSKKAFHGASLEYVAVGHKFRRDKDYMRSVAYFNRAVALDPYSFIASLSLAETYYLAGFFELAGEEYRIALELSRRTGDDSCEINYINRRLRDIEKKQSVEP